jgi:hypothetical protein
VSCRVSREMLALHVEGDLPDASAAATVRHLAGCEECRRFLEELQASQALMKSVRRETVNFSECSAMRREVMRAINKRPGALAWRLRIERAIALGVRPSYGIAAVLLAGIVSVSVLAQIRPATHQGFSGAGLASTDTMERPEAYRDWILVRLRSADRVYINPSSYGEYARTGIFPEGTVFVWEAGPKQSHEGPHATSSTLLASLKDSTKFEGGWGFFDFGATGGALQAKVRALPESRGCRSCHRKSPLSLGA